MSLYASEDRSPLAQASTHGLAAHEVVLLLETDPRAGLSEAESRSRLGRYGPNVLPAARADSALRRFALQFHNPLIYVLLASGAIALGLGELVEASVIFGVVAVNSVVGFVQESRAQAALEALRSMTRTNARVVRDGVSRNVPSEQLVPGDVVLLSAGDIVPADIRLIEETGLEADESALTGESAPVVKDEVVLADSTPVADRRNMLYSATLITAGRASGVAVATGAETEIGEIHRLVGGAEDLQTPLTRKLARFSRLLTVVILALAAVAFGAGVLRGEKPADMFTAAVALAVGAIPEGLPAAVTITLAIGVTRLARRRAVIRRLPAVETLGSTTVICTDKTGTLTLNQMTVRTVWTASGSYDASGAGYSPEGSITGPDGKPAEAADLRWCLTVGVLCNDASLSRHGMEWHITGDPTEGALLSAAAKSGLWASDLLERYPRVGVIPFESRQRVMATFHRTPDPSAPLTCVKGSVEQVLSLCTTAMDASGRDQALDKSAVLAAGDSLAGRGLRVLAFAIGHHDAAAPSDPPALPDGLTFVGLQAMRDPPRPDAARAIRACRTAGVNVKIITGDHAATAAAVAAELELVDGNRPAQVITGAALESPPDRDLAEIVERNDVFARVSPEQKLRLVEALQRHNHIVAMTGDGVNDAPGLRQADIGVAMGLTGTEVAKDAADMILTDDSFATIEAAVEEGRGIFDNLLKFIVWTLPTNMAEGLVILTAIVAGTALPILPSQILWINMTTAVLLGLTLAFEPKEAGIMSRPPRDPRQPLLTADLALRTLLVSSLLVAGSWWLFEWERSHGADIDQARATALNLFVMVEAFYLISCRSLEGSTRRLGLLSNPWLIGGLASQAAAQLAVTYLPVMQTLFQTVSLDLGAWLRITAVAVAAITIVSVEKRVHRRRAGPPSTNMQKHRSRSSQGHHDKVDATGA